MLWLAFRQRVSWPGLMWVTIMIRNIYSVDSEWGRNSSCGNFVIVFGTYFYLQVDVI